jgi:hypothetical protein
MVGESAAPEFSDRERGGHKAIFRAQHRWRPTLAKISRKIRRIHWKLIHNNVVGPGRIAPAAQRMPSAYSTRGWGRHVRPWTKIQISLNDKAGSDRVCAGRGVIAFAATMGMKSLRLAVKTYRFLLGTPPRPQINRKI